MQSPLQNVNFIHRCLLFSTNQLRQSIRQSTVSSTFREATFEFGAIGTFLSFYVKNFYEVRNNRFGKKIHDPRGIDNREFGSILSAREPYPKMLHELCAIFCERGCGLEFVDAALTAVRLFLTDDSQSVGLFLRGANYKEAGYGAKITKSLLIAAVGNPCEVNPADGPKVVECFVRMLVEHAAKYSAICSSKVPPGVAAGPSFLHKFLSDDNALSHCLENNQNRDVALAVTKLFLQDTDLGISKNLEIRKASILPLLRAAVGTPGKVVSSARHVLRKTASADLEIVKILLNQHKWCDFETAAGIFPELAFFGKLSAMKQILAVMRDEKQIAKRKSKHYIVNLNTIFDFKGLSAIHLALFHGGSGDASIKKIIEMIRFLVQNGQDVNLLSQGRTSMAAHISLSRSQRFTEEHLSKTSNCVNHHMLDTWNTYAPLHILSYSSFVAKSPQARLALIKALVEEFGADVKCLRCGTETPLDVAKSSQKEAMAGTTSAAAMDNSLIVKYLESKM